MTDKIRTAPDVRWRTVGTGMCPTWRCMGCDKFRVSTGSRGVGVKRRCAVCVAEKAKGVAK